MTIKVDMQFFRSTKNTHVYISEDKQDPVKTVYIEKSGIQQLNGEELPKNITVTVEEVK